VFSAPSMGHSAYTDGLESRPRGNARPMADYTDAVRIGKDTMRQIEAGPDGIEFVAFGAGEDPRDVEMAPGWWSD